MRTAALIVLAACGGGGATDAGWVEVAPMARGARQELAVVVLGDALYVIGGFDPQGGVLARVEKYDPATDRWSDVAPLPRALHHANAGVVGGKIVVAGGLIAGFGAVGDVFLYDPQQDEWTPGPAMPDERGAAAVAVIGERLYVAGGLRGGQSVADFSALEGGVWQPLPDLPAPRDHLMAAAADGKLYVIGGRDRSALTARVDIWDGATWSSGTPMPTARAASSAAVFEGEIYVAGGEGNPLTPSGIFVEVEAYDVTADRWRTLAPMRTPRHGTNAGVIAGRIWIPGGALVQGFGATAILEGLEPL